MLLCRTPVKPTNACAAAHQGTQMPCGRSSGRSHMHTSCRAANVLTHQTHCCCKADGTAAAAARRYVPAKYSCCSCVAAAVLGLPVCYKPYTHAHKLCSQPREQRAPLSLLHNQHHTRTCLPQGTLFTSCNKQQTRQQLQIAARTLQIGSSLANGRRQKKIAR